MTGPVRGSPVAARLTEAGQRLLRQLEPTSDALGDALRRAAAASLQLEGTLRIGVVNPSAGAPRLLEIIDAFESEHPKCRVELVQLPLRDRLGPLRRGEVAAVMACVPLDSPDVVVGPVLTRDVPSPASTSAPASAAHCPIAANDLDPAITAAIPTASSPASGCRRPRLLRGSGTWARRSRR